MIRYVSAAALMIAGAYLLWLFGAAYSQASDD